jgi:hypothetical protein
VRFYLKNKLKQKKKKPRGMAQGPEFNPPVPPKVKIRKGDFVVVCFLLCSPGWP